MISLRELLALDGHSLALGGDVFGRHAAELGVTSADLSRASTVAGWSGPTHNRMVAAIADQHQRARTLANVCREASDTARDCGRELDRLNRRLRRALDELGGVGWSVDDAGRLVSASGSGDVTARISRLHGSALAAARELEDADSVAATQLRTVGVDLARLTTSEVAITGADGRPIELAAIAARLQSGSAPERRALLAGWSDADQRILAATYPAMVGNLDGVPFSTRVYANEINVRDALAAETAAHGTGSARAQQLTAMLAPIPDPRNPNRLVDRTFLSFAPAGRGRMIELIGAPPPLRVDRPSPSVGVIVPGTGTNLDGSGSNHRAAWQLAARSGGPVILYLDGDFPQDLVKEAPDPSYAANLAPRLVAFGADLDREFGPDGAVTYLGHSYGGAVVGSAEQLGLRADRVVYASAAGTGIFDTGWHNPNPDVQRYAMTAPGDPIGLVQSLELNPLGANTVGPDPGNAPGVINLDPGHYSMAGQHGGEVIAGLEGHGQYWDDPDSDAFAKLVAVVRGDAVRPDETSPWHDTWTGIGAWGVTTGKWLSGADAP